MNVILIFNVYYCNIITSLSLITLLTKKYKIQKQICEGKYIVFWNFQDYLKHENFKIH
jgi:hypothetical protein